MTWLRNVTAIIGDPVHTPRRSRAPTSSYPDRPTRWHAGRPGPGRRRAGGGRRSRPGRVPDPGRQFRLQPRQPRHVRLPAGQPPVGRSRGRAAARLRPERDRLLRQLRLAEVRRPVEVRADRARAAVGQQLQLLLQLVRDRRHQPGAGRGALHQADGRPRPVQLRHGRQPGVRQRTVSRRGDERGHARHLSGRLRGGLDHRRRSLPVRHRDDQRLLLHEPRCGQDPGTVGRPGAQRSPRLLRPAAEGGRLARHLRLHRGGGERHRVPRPVDQRARRGADPDQHRAAAGEHHPGGVRQRRGPGLPGLRHGARHSGRPGHRRGPVRHRRRVLPGHHLLGVP